MIKGNLTKKLGSWWLAPAGILLMIAGNHYLNEQRITLVGVLALVTGALCMVIDVRRSGWVGYRPPLAITSGSSHNARQWLLVGTAVVAGALAWLLSGDNTFRTSGVIAWIVAIIAWLAAWWTGGFPIRRGKVVSVPRSISTLTMATVAGVIAALAIGSFYRLYHIDGTPLNPTSDHAEKLLDVTDVLNGMRPIFFERNTGREPIQFYFTAGLINLFDLPATFTTLKIGTAIVGIVAILFIYLLTAEYAGRAAGLSAAFLVAVSAWGTEISRAGLRFPYGMVASAAVLWVLVRWMRTRDRRDALVCGLFIGIGLNGYTPFRVVVPAVCLGIAISLIAAHDRATRIRLAFDGVLIGATAAVVFIPLGRYAFDKPSMFWERSASRMTSDDPNAAEGLLNQLPVFLRNNWHAAIGPFWRGDSTFVNAVTNVPMMDLVTGALLLAGLAAIGTHIVLTRDARAIFLVTSIPILLLSSTLSLAFPWENPSVNREGPAIPVVFAIAALPIALMAQRLADRFGRITGGVIAAYAAAGLIAVAATQNYREYFHDFDYQTRRGVANTPEIAEVIRGGATVGVALEDTYVIDVPNWMDIRNVGFELGNIDWALSHNLADGAPLPPQPDGRPMLFVLNSLDTTRLQEVERTYPTAIVNTYASEAPDRSFVTVYVPAE